MGRRRKNNDSEIAELALKGGLLLIVLLAFGVGGVKGFGHALASIVVGIFVFALGAGVLALAVVVGIRVYRRRNPTSSPTRCFGGRSLHRQPLTPPDRSAAPKPGIVRPSASWTFAPVRKALNEIDWYQFEKFCAALLKADGFDVERKGGAHPDGGVDLVVKKDGVRALIQCKHRRSWTIQEKVVREMLGSMTHYKVAQGAIYTLKGWTEPAARFATEHSITLVNGDELAESALVQLAAAQLDEVLRPGVHHCPKCEAVMVERKGAFGSFWGCSSYPRCRGKLKHAGAR